MADSLEDRLNDIASGPAQAAADGVSYTEQDPLKVIEIADRQAALDASKKNRRMGLRYGQFQPRGNCP
jgi:hypothetical protein